MWRRNNAQQTGANQDPLGAPRRWGGGGPMPDYSSVPPPPPPPSDYDHGYSGGGGGGGGGGRNDWGGGGSAGRWSDRDGGSRRDGASAGGYGGSLGGRIGDIAGGGGGGYDDLSSYASPAVAPISATSSPAPPTPSSGGAVGGEKKKRSRWGAAKVEIAGLPTAIMNTGEAIGETELDKYAVHLRLEEINRKLRGGDFVPASPQRSPSPPPTYDSHGRRTNTREVRYRRRLEDERIRLVENAMKKDPMFKPPPEYHMAKRAMGGGGKPQDKVYIPVKEFPEINFFGLLVGPRGNSLKKMERESGAKISIRGKGSVKEGKGRPGGNGVRDDDEDEELHCLVMGENNEKVDACVRLINRVIETAASTPEGENDHKRNQLRELALLNGTLRDDENQICQNCGNVGHRKYDCPETKNFTAGIICRTCGGAGHMARDCTQRRGAGGFGTPGAGAGGGTPGGAPNPFENELSQLMAEISGEVAANNNKPSTPGGTNAPPGGGTPGGYEGSQGGATPWGGQGGQDGSQGMGMGMGMGAGGTGFGPDGKKIPPWRIPSNWHPPQPPSGGGYGGGYQRNSYPSMNSYNNGYGSYNTYNVGGQWPAGAGQNGYSYYSQT